jgi:Spy/CpxP family protein refolding chaperone
MKSKLLLITVSAAVLQLSPLLYGQDDESAGTGPRHHRKEHFANLTPEERQKLQAAHRQAMQDPAIQSAHDKLRQARRDYRDSLHAAMLKADPSIQPILNKLPKHEREED